MPEVLPHAIERWTDASARNLRHAFRSLQRSPTFSIISILILAAGVGSNFAVFSTLDAMFLRPLRVERPDELLKISLLSDHGTLLQVPSTAIRALESNPSLHGVCGSSTPLRSVELRGNTRQLGVTGFTGSCFATLGLRLQLGRPITPADDHTGAAGVAVVTDSFWRSDLGGRRDILGQTLKIEDAVYTIVGVTQPGFTGLLLGSPQPIMIPLLAQPRMLANGTKPSWYWVNLLARRAPGVSEAQARASVLGQTREILEQSIPHRFSAAERKWYLAEKLAVTPGRSGFDYFLRRRFGEPLYAVFGICAALLLIGCVNLSSLLVARGLNRRRELSIRLALGGSRSHVAGLFVLENAMLLLVGTAAGVFGGLWAAEAILAKGGTIFGNFQLDIAPDMRVVLFLAAIVLAILAIFAIVSISQAGRVPSSGALKEGGRGVIAASNPAQRILLGTQIAITLAFVAASGLFAASLKNMYGIDFGIDARNLWEMELADRPNHPPPPAYYRKLLQQLESLPDVQSATVTNMIPFYSYDVRDQLSLVENAQAGTVQARDFAVGDSFLQTVGAKVIAGEEFRRDDSNSGEPTAIVSESLARHFQTTPSDLIGRHVRIGSDARYQHVRIIGVASDADLNLANLDDTRPFTVYLNFWQHPELEQSVVLLIRTRGDALPSSAIRRILRQSGDQFVDRVTTIGGEIDNALVENRFVAYLSSAFGVLALAMAAIGLFGLLSYQVANRTSEIGVRMALGARRSQIHWLVARQILTVMVIGSLAGVALTFAAGKLVAGLLYRVSVYNPPLLLLAIAVLLATALAAAWIPMHRASAVDPIEALRHE